LPSKEWTNIIHGLANSKFVITHEILYRGKCY
jgi:hypothetical protein